MQAVAVSGWRRGGWRTLGTGGGVTLLLQDVIGIKWGASRLRNEDRIGSGAFYTAVWISRCRTWSGIELLKVCALMSLTRWRRSCRGTKWMRVKAVPPRGSHDMCLTSFLMLWYRLFFCFFCRRCNKEQKKKKREKFCCAERHKSGSAEAWARIGRPRRTVAANFPPMKM